MRNYGENRKNGNFRRRAMKTIFGIILLLFCVYCAFQIIIGWKYRNAGEKILWLILIIGGIKFSLYLI